jgi:hypothetical protein
MSFTKVRAGTSGFPLFKDNFVTIQNGYNFKQETYFATVRIEKSRVCRRNMQTLWNGHVSIDPNPKHEPFPYRDRGHRLTTYSNVYVWTMLL